MWQPVPGGDAGDEVAGVSFGPDQRNDQRLLDAGELAEEAQTPPGVVRKCSHGLDAGGRFRGEALGQLRRAQPAQLSGGFRPQADHRPDFQPAGLVPRQQQRLFEPEGFHADPQDGFGHRGGLGFLAQALARLRQRGQPAHLLVQRASPLLQVLGHGVESCSQLAELIATPDVEPLAEVTPGYRLCSGDQGLDRPRQPEREQVPDQEQDQNDAREQHRHLKRRLKARLHDAAPR